MNEGLEALVRQHVPWERMSAAARQTFSNSKEQWEQEVRNFSLRNQLNWRSGLVRSLYQDEKKYYEELVQLSRESLLVRASRSAVKPLTVLCFNSSFRITCRTCWSAGSRSPPLHTIAR